MIFFTVVSKGQANPAVYELAGRTSQPASTPALGILQLLEQQPTRVVALLTEAAANPDNPNWKSLRDGVTCSHALIPDGRTSAELEKLAQLLMSELDSAEDIVLDVSGGLRHHQFAILAAAFYVTQVREVRIQGIYSAAFELRKDTVPVIDLGGIVDWIRWFWAVKNWSDYRDLQGTIQFLQDYRKSLHPRDQQNTRSLEAAVKGLHWSFLNALPVEFAYFASQFQRQSARANLPWALEVAMSGIAGEDFLKQEFAPEAPLDASAGEFKKTFKLTEGHLERQLAQAKELCDHGHLVPCITLLNEWADSLALLRGQQTNWLQLSSRTGARKPLAVLHHLCKDHKEMAEALARRWGLKTEFAQWVFAVADLRNQLAHNGMRPPWVDLEGSRKAVQRKLREAAAFLESSRSWNTMPSACTARLLVAPLGHTPGSLYSAILGVKPDHLVVLTSEDAEGAIPEVLEQAEYSGPVEVIKWVNPWAGFLEIRDFLKDPKLSGPLLQAGQSFVCITGGTTCLSHGAGEVHQWCRRHHLPSRRFALIDQRPPQVQKAEPWVQGQVHWLDEPENDSD